MVTGEKTLNRVAKTIFPHPTRTEPFDELARWQLNRPRRTAKKYIPDRFNDKGRKCGPCRFRLALRCLLPASRADVQTTFGDRLLFGQNGRSRRPGRRVEKDWERPFRDGK
jgi:hypothetical protein